MSKNKAAQALARMRRGIKEQPSARKLQAAKRNLAGARQKRWLDSRVRRINEGFKYARKVDSFK